MRNRIALVAGLLLALGAFAPNAFAGTHRTMTYVHPFVDCVTQGSGSYDATFGYTNQNSTPQTVVVGSDNYFTPPPIDRGQTTVFQPGTVHNAFTVKAIPTATKVTWTVSLNGHTESVSVSSSSSHSCTTTPPTPAIHVSVDCVTRNADNTYDATFGYANDATAAQTVAVGTDNYFAPPPIDRGQTTVFQPGSHHAAFTVKAIPNATKLVWTVLSHSTTASSSGKSCAPTSTTQVIHVSVDCVTKGATTYDATFAYANDNAVAETVAVGTDNYFSPPAIDRGQTTVFQPGSHHQAFTVKAIPNATKLAWTVAFGGSSRTATASSSSPSCTPATTGVIHVSVDCVTKNATTYDATFAYANDNAAAQTVQVGSDNFFSPPPIDRGQTTTFQPGSHHAAFTVTGIPLTTKVTWTVAFGGSTRTATASSSDHSCTPTVKRVDVFVQCVTRNQGSYDATFGYENDNATAQTVPVGSDNFFSPPPIDRGQTSTFQPGKVQSAFTVKGIPTGTKLTWTVNSGGRTDTATATNSSHQCASTTPPAKVTICHRTNSKRQWVQITVSQKSANWYLRHGDVMPTSAGCPAPKHHHHHNQVRQEKRRA
jgi:phosphoribosyl-AMP cyclohydrolase